MGIPEGDITIAQAEGVTELDLQLEGGASIPRVSDLSALRYFTNLTSLNLSWTMYNNGNNVDISPLSSLTKLENLSICCDDVADIGALAEMTNMKSLWIWGNGRITDISALAGMTQMESLWMNGNSISDIGALSGMTNLNTLYMDENSITDITPLSKLTKLIKLRLAGNPILDYGPVQSIYPGLQEQDFDLDPDNDVITFNDPVLEARVREAIGKPEGEITFADAKKVTKLELGIEWQNGEYPPDTQITNIDALKYFVNLKDLGLGFHAITDISALAELTNLSSLGLGGNPVQDITPLSGLTNLGFLTLFSCQAGDYSALKNLVNLGTLYLENSTIRDLSCLSGLTNLKELLLKGDAITDYSPLKKIYPNLTNKDFEMP